MTAYDKPLSIRLAGIEAASWHGLEPVTFPINPTGPHPVLFAPSLLRTHTEQVGITKQQAILATLIFLYWQCRYLPEHVFVIWADRPPLQEMERWLEAPGPEVEQVIATLQEKGLFVQHGSMFDSTPLLERLLECALPGSPTRVTLNALVNIAKRERDGQ